MHNVETVYECVVFCEKYVAVLIQLLSLNHRTCNFRWLRRCQIFSCAWVWSTCLSYRLPKWWRSSKRGTIVSNIHIPIPLVFAQIVDSLVEMFKTKTQTWHISFAWFLCGYYLFWLDLIVYVNYDPWIMYRWLCCGRKWSFAILSQELV